METENPKSQGFFRWIGESVTLKLFVIGVLALLLLIPASMITSLIRERNERQELVVAEIGQSWAGPQTIGGPVLMIPYENDDLVKYIYVLPDQISITAAAETEFLKRGIYKAAVYDSKITMQGHFSQPDLQKLGIAQDLVLWHQAQIVLGLGDLKGLKEQPALQMAGQSFEAESSFAQSGVFARNLVAPLSWPRELAEVPFDVALMVRGNDHLQFLQLAKETSVSVTGNWPSPSFNGDFLPTSREVSAEGFVAQWNVVHFSRPLPQQWVAESTTLVSEIDPFTKPEINPASVESFGVQFLQVGDHYHKTERAAKYALLIIALTFVSLLFSELLAKKKVHIIQYLLIGGAMIVFYSLLLSLSEFLGFNLAYGIGAVATVTLISLFIHGLLGQRQIAWYFAIILSVFYGLIFLLIQLTDTALLVGSVGLFIILAILMYFSRKIKWNTD